MSRAFDVSAVTDALRLSSSGTGEAAFLVTNLLDGPVRARVTVVPGPRARREWFSLEGEAERELPSKAAQRLAVRLRVPPGTPPGRFTFHVRVEDAAHPEARFVEGPVAAFEVAAAPAAAKAFPMNGAVMAVGVFILAGTVLSLLAAQRGGGPGAGAPCPDGLCGAGLTCEAREGGSVCLASRGQPCDAGSECVTGFCEPGVGCEVPLGKTCATEADCPGRLTCAQVLDAHLCLLEPEQPCKQDRDCASFFCNAERQCNREDGRCDSNADCKSPSQCGAAKLCQLPDGQPCMQHEACLSGFCNETCQVSPESFQCESPCPAYSACVSGNCVPVQGRVLNQNLLLTAPRTLKGIQELRIEQGIQP